MRHCVRRDDGYELIPVRATSDVRSHKSSVPRDGSCPGFATRRPSMKRAQGMPDATCAPAASRAKQKSTRDSHHRSAERSRTPCANGFNGLLRALPGDRALLSPSSARCMSIVTDLMPASRHQDHAISPYAFHAVRHRRKGVHRIPHPTFVTIAKRPSSRARDARDSAGVSGARSIARRAAN